MSAMVRKKWGQALLEKIKARSSAINIKGREVLWRKPKKRSTAFRGAGGLGGA